MGRSETLVHKPLVAEVEARWGPLEYRLLQVGGLGTVANTLGRVAELVAIERGEWMFLPTCVPPGTLSSAVRTEHPLVMLSSDLPPMYGSPLLASIGDPASLCHNRNHGLHERTKHLY